MNEVIPILQDIILEIKTARSYVEYDDPVSDNFDYIEGLTKSALEKLENMQSTTLL